jgi:hypothetical protein
MLLTRSLIPLLFTADDNRKVHFVLSKFGPSLYNLLN